MSETLEEAVARYLSAERVHEREPGPPDDPAAVEAVLADIEQEIEPLLLPDELKRFWRNWDPFRFEDLPFPALIPPDSALESYRMHLEEGAPFPAVLFPIGYQSHCYWLVELIHESWEGPRVYEYCSYEGALKLKHLAPAGIFDVFVDALEAAETDEQLWRNYDTRRPLIEKAWDEADRLTTQRIESTGPVSELSIPANASLEWPERWQQVQGLDPTMAVPMGRTHTAAEFETARQRGSVEARLVGNVSVTAGGGIVRDGAATLLRLRDETGEALVLIPDSACPFGGPRSGGCYEIEVVGGPAPAADLDLTDVNTLSRSITDNAESGNYLEALQAGASSALGIHQALVLAGQAAIQARLVRPLTNEPPLDT